MPELPEVETTRRGLLKLAKGKRIQSVVVRRGDLRVPLPALFSERLTGKTIREVRRRAKYLLMDLDSGETVLAHLGMSGSWVVVQAEGYVPRTHDHVLIHLENKSLLVFHDPRRFGLMDILSPGQEATHPLLAHLGPEPLSEDFSPAYLAAQLQRRKGAIKPTLMDQKLVVGVGNIYASESLYLSGINPNISAAKLEAKSAAMVAAIRQTLEAAIASGGSTLRDYVGTQNEGGYFQHHFNVYGRANDPCFRCQTPIASSVQAGRTTYWCPQCQPMRQKRQKT